MYYCNSIFYLFPNNIGDGCVCRDWHGCIMAQSIVGLENVQPYKFSDCSKSDYIESLRGGQGLCLLNKPNEVSIQYSLLYFTSLTKQGCWWRFHTFHIIETATANIQRKAERTKQQSSIVMA